jgi:thioredoxin 1
MAVIHLNDQNFKKEVLESGLPVIVDFWATWCAPCKKIAPIVEELGCEYSAKIRIGKIDVEESPATTSFYGVMSIPTLIFFKDGKVLSQCTGALSKADLKAKIEEELL